MTQDEIIEMARQAGMAYEEKLEVYVANIDDLQDFAKLVAAKEREACAKVCLSLNLYGPYSSRDIQFATLEDCARAIRARGEA